MQARHEESEPLHAQHTVAIVYHGHAVGYKDDGALSVCQQIGQQAAFCVRVERACSLVEEHHAAVAQQRPGYGYALRLTFAQSPPDSEHTVSSPSGSSLTKSAQAR